MSLLSEWIVSGTRVLDAGCGHGDEAEYWASLGADVIGVDFSQAYVDAASHRAGRQARYIWASTKESLPFADDSFDVIYTKKGPSVYREANRLTRRGGRVAGLHPDRVMAELPELLPGLFPVASEAHSLEHTLQTRLRQSGLDQIEMRPLRHIEYLQMPEDVIRYRCFGQSENVRGTVHDAWIDEITNVFQRCADVRGLRVTSDFWLITAVAD